MTTFIMEAAKLAASLLIVRRWLLKKKMVRFYKFSEDGSTRRTVQHKDSLLNLTEFVTESVYQRVSCGRKEKCSNIIAVKCILKKY